MNKTKYKSMLERNFFSALEDSDDSDDELTYMQDGASYHRAKLVKDDNDVNFFEWPAPRSQSHWENLGSGKERALEAQEKNQDK